ncbi:hypothetical protein K431DRAFT_193261, partial [Polychaeton citri CBS 116435]
TSSKLPVADPVICSQVWPSAWGTGSYFICCPTSYQVALPSVTADPERPAYGGICYSNSSSGQVLEITAYNDLFVTATAQCMAPVTNAQIYANPTDG